MNYFRCTVGGSGKGNTVTVTCAEEFAGLTITLAKTGKTYTKTCPSTAPYVVTFYGVENGTYTVSTTYDGQTYSETVIVQDISCVLNYGFNWKLWVDTASQLDSSDYDSLDEVLADEKALRELFLEHACVDYMASVAASNEDLETIINNDLCAKWINLSDYALDFLGANTVIKALMDEADKYGYGEWALMPQVPTMTSNTAPYGTVGASSVYSGDTTTYAAWKAFDGNDSTRWNANSKSNERLYYHFTNATRVTRVDLKTVYDASMGGARIKNFKVQGSDDGTTWTDIPDASFVFENNGNLQSFTFENDMAYEYVGVLVEDMYDNSTTDYVAIYTLQFYAWAPKGNVPKMTSDTAPYGKVVYSQASSYSDYPLWKVFDGDDSTRGSVEITNSRDVRVGYNFVSPCDIKRVMFRPFSNLLARVTKFKVQYSDDGTNISNATDWINGTGATEYNIDVQSVGYHLYWYVFFYRANGDQYPLPITTLQFYGRELKVSVPTMTSNTAPFGEASASSQYDANFPAWKAFDNVKSEEDIWASAGHQVINSWIAYDFGTSDIVLREVSLMNRTAGEPYAISTFKIQGFDGESWNDITDILNNGSTSAGAITFYTINSDTRYKKVRLLVLSATGNIAEICELRFYGLDYSEKEFEAGTTKKWLYDHGVELETFDWVTEGTGVTMTKEDSQIVVDDTSTSYAGVIFVDSSGVTSDYSLLRLRIGNKDSFNDTAMVVKYSKEITANNYGVLSITSSNAPNNFGLDVSNINSGYVGVNASSRGATGKISISEWWLE